MIQPSPIGKFSHLVYFEDPGGEPAPRPLEATRDGIFMVLQNGTRIKVAALKTNDGLNTKVAPYGDEWDDLRGR